MGGSGEIVPYSGAGTKRLRTSTGPSFHPGSWLQSLFGAIAKSEMDEL